MCICALVCMCVHVQHVCVCVSECILLCTSVHLLFSFFVLFSAAEDPDQFMTLVCSQPGPPYMINRKDINKDVLLLFDSDFSLRL